MADIENGGPAFPCDLYEGDPNDPGCPPQRLVSPGLSIRDYFAGQALAGLCDSRHVSPVVFEKVAGHAYEIADAMLLARAASKEG